MHNNKRFYIIVISENLKGDGNLLQQFHALKDDIEKPENMFQFEEWVLGALDEFLETNAPTPVRDSRKPITLLKYFSPPTFVFTVVN
ncbi:hypothetical protein FZEAL_902 [Fusarium zealandicum]|uniref:Uncharacterized protein n=1 Tax=Fusarium zealandicum TaxID=1053134 RepID=A0A8H4UUH3_9HYPO|nr:hypothetical protein FZEAL_902 [Fusarium zealandicum]